MGPGRAMTRLLGRFFDDHRSFYVILAGTVPLGIIGGWVAVKILVFLAVILPSYTYEHTFTFKW